MNWARNNRKLTGLETYMIRRFHPRRIFVDAAALPWTIYFLWGNDWQWAALSLVISAVAGVAFTVNVDAEKYSGTLLGRLGLLHMHPLNMAVQLVGIAGIVWAIWNQSTMGILGALSVIFLGHMAGWDEFFQEASVKDIGKRVA